MFVCACVCFVHVLVVCVCVCACACHSYAFLSSKHNKPPSQNTTILQEILPVCRSAKMAASQIQLSGIYGGGDTEQNTHKQQRRWGTLNDIFLSNYKMQEKGLKTNNSAHFNDCSKINWIWELTFLWTSDTFAIWTRCWLCAKLTSLQNVLYPIHFTYLWLLNQEVEAMVAELKKR